MSRRFPAGKPAQDILSIVFILNPSGAKIVFPGVDPDPSPGKRMNHPAIAPRATEIYDHALQI
jgi:hypothetical protein